MFKDYIEVYYSTGWREVKIATIPKPIKHRHHVKAIIDSLNCRYIGYGSFYAIEVSYHKQPCGTSGSVYGINKRIIAGMED